MKKGVEITIIIATIVIMVAGAFAFMFLGYRAIGTHYVCIEVNPRVEFLTNGKKEVVSFKPLNEEAKELLINEEIVGLNVVEASEKFVDLCTKAGYIDVDGKENAVKISVLSGLNQALEVNLHSAILKYFTKNEIFGAVLDSTKDLNLYKTAKKQGVSAEKYDLMLAVKENNEELDMKNLKKKSSRELIDVISKQHKVYEFDYTQEQLEKKESLINANKEKYESHKSNITEKTTKEFREKYTKYLKTDAKKYEQNFDKTYAIWRENE